MRFLSSFLALLAVLLVAPSALADAIGPPPERCPEGSAEMFCHGPPTCRATECMVDSECGPGRVCQERNLCVVEHGCGGRLGTPVYTHVAGACGEPACAAEGAGCRVLRVCVPEGSTPPDAGPRDAGPVDAGSADGGPGGKDAGGGTDAGGGVDSGTPGRDSGTPGRDSGTPPRDAGTGTGGRDDGGCGCHVPSTGRAGVYGMLLLAGMLAIVIARRRRR